MLYNIIITINVTFLGNVHVSTHSTGIPEATVYAGQVFYQREERRDLMRFTAARDLNVLHQVTILDPFIPYLYVIAYSI